MTENEFNLKFTGKASVIIGIENHDPIQFNITDPTLIGKIIELMVDESIDISVDVTAYSKREGKALSKILDNM
jgi:hypothetical protein